MCFTDKRKRNWIRKEDHILDPVRPLGRVRGREPSHFPFPQRFQKAKLVEQFSKFLNIFKKLEVNIPFVDALAQMPN